MRSASAVGALSLALLPVAAFAFLVGSVVVFSLPTLQQIGAGLLDAQYDGFNRGVQGTTSLGLLAPLWGTVLMALITLSIAIPGALAVALLISEYQLGPVSRVLSPALGLLSGIPPIVYALLALVVVEVVMRPKFGGSDLDESVKAVIHGTEWVVAGKPVLVSVRLPDGLPNSQVLGGFMLALLVVPLIAPLIEDALRAVPDELRLGSYALGAGRWHTLTHLVLPYALPGIVSAITLGALTAVGEVVIPYFVVSYGLEVVRMPNPPWDIFWHTQPLSSTGVLALGGFAVGGTGGPPRGLPLAMAYTTGLALLLLAFAITAAGSVARALLQREARA